METQTPYYYSNSSTRNGTCMDSPPPPYTGGGDLSFEGVRFYVVGSGRKVVPCQHCRRDFGTFDTLLLHSEGLKKGSVRNEVIFTVNVLERYNATGNYQLADVRPPLYQIPSSSHFGAEYCRHCNQVDSLTNKPLSCASTRAETSSHDSLSDVEQFSNSLDDNAPSTNKYVSKYDHPEDCSQEDNLTSGRQHQNGQSQSTEPEGHRQHITTSQRHQDYISNSNQRTPHQKRSSSPKNKMNQDSQPPITDFSTQPQTDYIHSDSPEYFKASYPDDLTNESKTALQNNHLKSIEMTLPYESGTKYPVVAPQENEVFLAEDVKKLKDPMSSKIRDVFKKKTDTKTPYIGNRLGQDLEALKNDLLTDPETKNIINKLVENSISSWISSNPKALILSDALKDSESKVFNRKGGIPPPLKINARHDVVLNDVNSKEFVAEKSLDDADKNGQNDNALISNNEEFSETTHIPQSNESYSPSQKVDIESDNNQTSDITQTPANDSGILSPGSNFTSSQKKLEPEYNESNSFRHNSYDITSDVGSPPDAKIAEKREKSHYTDYDNGDISSDDDNSNNNNNNSSNVDDDDDDDNDDANVTNSCKSEAENYDSHRNMTCETSSDTATVCSTSSAYINDEENDGYEYDVTNSVMSPRDGFVPWDFCRSISLDRFDCHNNSGNDNPSPDQTFCGHKQKFRRTSGEDTQPTIASLKKNFTTFEKIENTPIIYQEIPNTFSTPRHSRVNLLDSDSPEWHSKAVDRVSSRYKENSSSKDSNRRPEKRGGDKPQDSDYISVAKRLNFENCSSPPVSDITSAVTAQTAENTNKTPSYSVSEASLTNSQQPNKNEISETCQNRQTLPPSSDEKTTKKNSNANANPQKRDLPAESANPQKRDLPAESAHPKKQPRRVKINDKRQADCSCKVNKERFPLKEPDQEALTTCKARAILQSLETSNKTIGTYTPIELENVRTKSSSQNLLFTGGPFQADQNFRSWLADIVCNKNGQYIVSDWSNCCVQMFSTAGLPGDRVTFTSGPWGLALMSESVVACTVPHAKQISLLSHGSRLIVVGLVSTIRRYWGIAVTNNQNLVCSCIQGIDLLTRDGKILRTIQYNEVGLEFFVFPQYLTVGDNGVIYVSDSCGTYLIGLPEDGDFSFSFKPLNGIKLKTPRAIEYGRDGFVYIADTDTDKIYRIKEDGTLDSELFTAADNVQGPLAITLRDNKMIVTQKDSSILILPI